MWKLPQDGSSHGQTPVIRSPADVSQLLMSEMRFQAKEHFRALLLDARNQVTRVAAISVGMVALIILGCTLLQLRVQREAPP